MTRSSWLGGLVFVVACSSSSGSGVSGSKRLTALSASEQAELCDYIDEVIDGPRTVSCDDGTEVTLEPDADCTFEDVPASCAATVRDAERCAKAQSDDPCSLDFEACAALLQCAFND